MSEASFTILYPFGGNASYGRLAINSIIKHSKCKSMGLVITVEPIVSDEDRKWADDLPNAWPGPVRIIHNTQRRGYYGSVNETVRQCPTEIAILFTNDQVASPGWDEKLLRYVAPNRFVTGLLVESGGTLIADRTIWKRFGTQPENFKEADFLRFCASYRPQRPLDLPRHYIPMAFYRKDFIRVGMFVEGRDSMNVSTYREDFHFFLRCLDAGFELVEVQDALTYHFQSGSKRTKALVRGLLNWIYWFPLMRTLHRTLTGYVPLIDALEQKGARKRLDQILLSIGSNDGRPHR